MKDPEFRREYDALGPEFALIEALIEARTKKGMTQEEIAKKIGTKQSAISRFESGRMKTKIDFLYKLAEALGMKIQIVKV